MKIYMLGTIGGWDNSSFACCCGGGPGGYYLRNGEVVELAVGYAPWWQWGRDGCPNCRIACWLNIAPWPMTWMEGSERIGDLGGTGFPCWDMIAQKEVIDFFRKNGFFIKEFETFFEEVPPPSPRSRKPRDSVVCTTPYEGPPFWRFSPRYGVNINEEKSQKIRKLSCSVCGNIIYDTEKEYFWNKFVVDEEEWNGLKLFGIFEFGSLLSPGDGVFLSEEGYDLLMKQGFTNVKCVEVGRIEKAGHGKMKPYREQADYDFWKPDEYIPPPPVENKKRTKK